ncbi:MAG: hypothetical protein ACRYFR_04855 [Janthinobacterium lividum]
MLAIDSRPLELVFGSKYAICYYVDGELWTYTSCQFFKSQADAVKHFPHKQHKVAYTIRIKLFK